MTNNISLRILNLFMIFLLILPLIIISHHHRDFSDLKTTKIRLGKFHNSSTSQTRIITHSTNISIIRLLSISFHHSKNALKAISGQSMSFTTSQQTPTQPSSLVLRIPLICNQILPESMTRDSSTTRTLNLHPERFTSSTTRKFHFMMHLHSHHKFTNLHLIKPKITRSTYNNTSSTYSDPTLLTSIALTLITIEPQQPTMHKVSLNNSHKSPLTTNQITHNLVTTRAIHPCNFSQSQVIVNRTIKEKKHFLSHGTIYTCSSDTLPKTHSQSITLLPPLSLNS